MSGFRIIVGLVLTAFYPDTIGLFQPVLAARPFQIEGHLGNSRETYQVAQRPETEHPVTEYDEVLKESDTAASAALEMTSAIEAKNHDPPQVKWCALPPCDEPTEAQEESKQQKLDKTHDELGDEASKSDVAHEPSAQERCAVMLIPLFMAAVATVVPWHFKVEKEDVGPKDDKFEIEEDLLYLTYKDAAMEKKWADHSRPENIRFGSATLAFCLPLHIVFQARRVWNNIPMQCYNYWGHRAAIIEIVSLIGLLGASMDAARQKSAKFYYGLVLLFMIYGFVSCTPPLRVTCAKLLDDEMCQASRPGAVSNFDCGPQGTTQSMFVVSNILLLPLFVPKVNMMPYMWCGLVAYAIWSTLYHYAWTQPSYFSPSFLICSFAVLSCAMVVAMMKKKRLARVQRAEFQSKLKQREATEKMYNILAYMMPRHIVRDLIMHPDTPIAIPVERVSILFIVIADFEKFTSKYGPKQLLEFLNDQFSEMDAICETNRVTKVETVGEEYVACVGVIPEDIEEAQKSGHGQACERLFTAAGQMLALQTEEVKYKMGMHTGKIIAGVIGMKHLPRFRLFGDTINTTARLMQKGEKGKLQFGEETHKELPSDMIDACEPMREVTLKGKGNVKAWLFPKSGASLPAPDKKIQSAGKGKPRVPIMEIALKGKVKKMQRAVNAIKMIQKTQFAISEKATVDAEDHDSAENDGDPHLEQFDQILDEMMSNSQTFEISPEEEEKWEAVFQTSTFVNDLVSNLPWQALTIAVLTGLELIYMEKTSAWETPYYLELVNELLPGTWRIPLFLGCRGLLFLTIMAWWVVAQVPFFARELPKTMHFAMMISICVEGVLLITSYDIITDRIVEAHKFREILGLSALQNNKHAPINLVFKTLFVVVFYEIITTSIPHFFHFVGAAVFVTITVRFYDHKDDKGIEFMNFEGWLYLIMILMTGAFIAWKGDQSAKGKIQAQIGIEAYEKRIESILDTLMPPLVVERLRDGLPSVHSYSKATVVQSDLCGFTQLSATKLPEEVVQFMSDLFGRFDSLTDVFEVYKVETIGDAYIAGRAEEPLTKKIDPLDVLLFGLAMIKATADWAGNLGVDVTCRVGLHHGSCVGGIVGKDMQRYHLFGELMVQLDTLEATSIPAVAQVSVAGKKAIEEELKATQRKAEEAFGSFEERTEEFLQTSKGERHDFDEVDGKTFLVHPTL